MQCKVFVRPKRTALSAERAVLCKSVGQIKLHYHLFPFSLHEQYGAYDAYQCFC